MSGSTTREIECDIEGEKQKVLVITSDELVSIGKLNFNREELLFALGAMADGDPLERARGSIQRLREIEF